MAQQEGQTFGGPDSRKPALILGIVLSGALLALVAHRLWSVEKTSYFVVILAGILGICIASLFLRRLNDLLLFGLFMGIPVTGFFKTFFLTSAGYSDHDTAILFTSGVIGLGPFDLVIGALYALWLKDIFLKQTTTISPTWYWPDVFVGMLMLAYFISSWGAPEPKAAWFALIYQVRFVLVYYYVSRRLEWRHLPMLFYALCIIAILESLLAYYQFSSGKLLSLAVDRGAGTQLHDQYEIPGIERRNRATGTCYESHGFGLFAALLAQYLLVWMFNRTADSRLRMLAALALVMILIALVCSFSRTAWISAALMLSFTWLMHLVWGERQILIPTIFAAVIGLIALPWALSIVIERFSSATGEGTIEGRIEQFPIAWNIWKDHFMFGYGAGNYMFALDTYNRGGALDLPVHNVFLWIGAEMGLFGVFAYFGLAIGVMGRAFRYIRTYPQPVSRIALIVLACLMTSLLDGLTVPLYREPVVYMMFWLTLALGVALERLHSLRPQPGV